jgi:hypothetical protein
MVIFVVEIDYCKCDERMNMKSISISRDEWVENKGDARPKMKECFPLLVLNIE